MRRREAEEALEPWLSRGLRGGPFSDERSGTWYALEGLHSQGIAMKTLSIVTWILSSLALHVGANTPPVLEVVPEVSARLGQPIEAIPIRCKDAESAPALLKLRAYSSNPEVIPASAFFWEGPAEFRRLSIRPGPSRTGVWGITVEVTDPEGALTRKTFQVQVQSELPRLSIERIQPQLGWQAGPTLHVPIGFQWETSADGNLSVTAAITPNHLLSEGVSFGWSPGSSPKWRNLSISMPTQWSGGALVEITARRSGVIAIATFPMTVARAPLLPSEPESAAARRLPPPLESAPRIAVDWDGSGELEFVSRGPREVQIWGHTPAGYLMLVQASFEQFPLEVGVVDFDGDGQVDIVARGQSQIGLWRGRVDGERRFLDRIPLPNSIGTIGLQGMLWRDWDADGDLDALVVRENGPILLRQERAGWGVELVADASMRWPMAAADADGDGRVDLLALGLVQADQSSRPAFWKNDGRGRFTAQSSLPTSGRIRAVGWEDLDADGTPDAWVLQDATTPQASRVLAAYRRTLTGWVETGRAATLATDASHLTWADFDADGVLDVLLPFDESFGGALIPVPLTGSEWSLRLFLGDRAGGFGAYSAWRTTTRISPVTLVPSNAGRIGVNAGRVILANEFSTFNLPPTAPVDLRSWSSGKQVRLSWMEAWDLNQSAGLTYNVRVGTRPGAEDVVSCLSRPDGVRKIAAPGNVGSSRFLDLDLSRLPLSPLYWSVQAVDAALEGGAFAPEQAVEGFFGGTVPKVTFELTMFRTVDGSFFSRISGESLGSKAFLLETSTNLVQWQALRWIQPQLDGRFLEYDFNLDSGRKQARFFRAHGGEQAPEAP